MPVSVVIAYTFPSCRTHRDCYEDSVVAARLRFCWFADWAPRPPLVCAADHGVSHCGILCVVLTGIPVHVIVNFVGRPRDDFT